MICICQLCDDEATEGFVVFVLLDGGRVGTKELGVSFLEIFVGEAFVFVVYILPILIADGIVEFLFGLRGALTKTGTVGTLARGDGLRVFVLRVVTDDRATITVRGIKLAVTSKATTQLV